MGPIVAFREYIFRDVLPAFSNLNERAEQVANEYYGRIGSLPAGDDCSVDMGDVAEDAHDHSADWYEMMASLRQSMRNLLAAGLFHLLEQQLAALCRDGGFRAAPPRKTKLDLVADWYREYLRLDFKTLGSWAVINELRLVANAVKHGEGAATRQLRAFRPELFTNPDYVAMYGELGENGIQPHFGPVEAPMAGEDLFVSEPLLHRYATAAEALLEEIAGYFAMHHDEYFG